MITTNLARRSFSTQITAAVARGIGQPFSIEQLNLEDPLEGEVLVRVVATGICHTDIAVRDQHIPSPSPIVLGHEGVGVVEAVGSGVAKLKEGDHVIMSYASCGGCPNCQGGKPSYCASHRDVNFGGMRLDGSTSHTTVEGGEAVHGHYFRQSSFATHALATEANVLKVDKSLPLASLAPLGCGVQTGAGAILNTLKAHAGSSVAIYGAGSVGLSAVMAAKVAGATTIIAVDTNDSRLELAREVGATHVVDGKQVGLKELLLQLSDGGLQYALDTTGNPLVLRTAFESLRSLGVCALVGGSPPGTEARVEMLSLLLGRTLRGVIQGDAVSAVFLPQLLELHAQGRFPFDKLITYYDSLHDINQAVEDSQTGKVVKPVIRISEP